MNLSIKNSMAIFAIFETTQSGSFQGKTQQCLIKPHREKREDGPLVYTGFHRKGAKTQSLPGSKPAGLQACRTPSCFLCVFAPLRETTARQIGSFDRILVNYWAT